LIDALQMSIAGMNFLAGVLLMYLPSEADAYGALVVLMQHRRMRELYKEDLAWLQASCLALSRVVDSRVL
jgi:Rab-GTPase-TBC domain